eukprot:5997058-Pleurochrysis_carterae.AAC.1
MRTKTALRRRFRDSSHFLEAQLGRCFPRGEVGLQEDAHGSFLAGCWRGRGQVKAREERCARTRPKSRRRKSRREDE